jgi:nucleotide-binding universal stress UspA family protein
MSAIRTILHPTDFSERSESAFRLACALARDHGARLLVLHVVPPPQSVGSGEMPVTFPLSPAYREELEDQLRRFKAADPKLRVTCHTCHLEEGFAADEILRNAQAVNADLIVMGTHGRTGLGRLLMGSVAEEVVRKAACPVLTVKAPVAASTSSEGKAQGLVQAC